MRKNMQLDMFNRAKKAILYSDGNDSIMSIVNRDREAFNGLRMLLASDSLGASLQNKFVTSEYACFPFCGNGILAYSNKIEEQMLSGEAKIDFVSRAIFDTNILSDLPGYFSGDEISNRENIETVLNFVIDNLGGSIDWTFASLENLREAANKNNPWPKLKVSAARHFDKCGLTPISKEDLSKYAVQAEEQWEAWLESSECWGQVRRRDLCYAIMLYSVLECWEGRTIKETVSNLVDFCLNSFSMLPLKELYFGWKAITGIHEVDKELSVFAERDLRTPTKKSLERISALAWDLFIFRWCETLMTELKGDKFFIPVVVTLDKSLSETLKSCPLRAVLIDEANGKVEAIFDDELEFQNCLNNSISNVAKNRILSPSRQTMSGEDLGEALKEVIASLEMKVSEAVELGNPQATGEE